MSSFSEKLQDVLGTKELKNYKKLLTQLFAEFLGTFLYLSIVLCAGTAFSFGPLGSTFGNGLLIAAIVQIIGHVSGGHINPAVTVSVMIYGEITILRAVLYVAVQIIGAVAGSAVTYALTESTSRGSLGVTLPLKYLGPAQVFFFEFLQTFIIVCVFLSVTDSKRGSRGLGSAALALGLAVTACQCSCLPYTSSLNPVRSLGPAVIMNIWTMHWVFWFAPISGGICAGLVYRFLLTKPDLM